MAASTLCELLEASARTHSARPAARLGDETLSYAALHQWSTAIARTLISLGLQPGDRVALYQKKSLFTLAALYGILKARGAYVPIDPLAPAERAREILDQTEARYLFCTGHPLTRLHGEVPFLTALVMEAEDAAPSQIAEHTITRAQALAPRDIELPTAEASDLAYVLFTSGATGKPKGIAITHGQSRTFVDAATETFALSETDVMASHAPFHFDMSVFDIFAAARAGACAVLMPVTLLAFPSRIAKLIDDAGITAWSSVPTALLQLLRHGKLDERKLDSLRLVQFAGEVFPIDPLRALMERIPGAAFYNVYGQTEANSSTYYKIASLPAEDADNAALPIGKPLPSYRVFLASPEGDEITDPGVEGEIYVVSEAVALGYWRDEERTRALFSESAESAGASGQAARIYRTGDRAVYDGDGNLVFRGRFDLSIKRRGFRVEPEEIESVARRYRAIDDAAVVAVPDDVVGNHLTLVLASAADDFPREAFERYLSRRLPHYMIPDKIGVRKNLPRTLTGKLDRKALLDEIRQGAPDR